ncbi:hypothetical protein TpMuguga_01g02730 [Theileria parva strain Muguga]|uniref:uncharacterized protein n=1 Tax=Theileria parva strain Muguga TaxID=333668 RepID=UPI001C617875|nr:uncharacterized protein TpMuguga_01g02730 [Theileria parva strain Muguga]KAF5153411.1 hypothetical protein TpMuguga_01g02730 [Theileria parva strain Muguga]
MINLFNKLNSTNFLNKVFNFYNFTNKNPNFYNTSVNSHRFYSGGVKRCKNSYFTYESVESDYNKYFKPKKDLMKSFPQGYIKVVKLKGISYNNYSKYKIKP